MKNSGVRHVRSFFVYVFVLSVFLVLFGNRLVEARGPIRFVFNYEDKEVFPYWIGDGTKVTPSNGGTILESIQLIDEKIDEIQIIYKRFPWKRCQENLKTGKADGIVGSFKQSRMEMGEYPMTGGRLDDSRYLHTQSYCLYTLKNSCFSWDGEKFSNPQGTTVVVPRGYSIINFLEQRGIQVYEISTTDKAVLLLSKCRVDGLASLCLTADAALKRQKAGRKQIVKTDIPLQSKKYYIILSKQFVKKYPELSNKIWRISREVGEKYYPAMAQKYTRQE